LSPIRWYLGVCDGTKGVGAINALAGGLVVVCANALAQQTEFICIGGVPYGLVVRMGTSWGCSSIWPEAGSKMGGAMCPVMLQEVVLAAKSTRRANQLGVVNLARVWVQWGHGQC
jgi:hypothetical protein